MRKLVVIALAVISMSVSAQNAVLTKGEKVATFGIGFGGIASEDVTFTTPSILVEASFDYGVSDKIWYGYFSAGAYLSRAGNSETVTTPAVGNYSASTQEYKASTITVAGRFLYHWDLYEWTKKDIFTKLDFYSGLQMGLAFQNIKLTDTSEDGIIEVKDNQTKFRVSGVAGARYKFNEQFCAYLEYGSKPFSVGIGYNF